MTHAIIIAAIILGASIVIGAFVYSGRYTAIAVNNAERPGYVILIDKFTDTKMFCAASECRPIPEGDSK